MFGTYFYHQRIRKAVAVFGSLFNNLYVIRKNTSGAVISQVKVPLSYAPKRDFLERLDNMLKGEDAEKQVAVKLPRMSFEIVSMNYDATRQLPKMNSCVIPTTLPDGSTAQRLYSPVPYVITFQLSIYAKSQDDALQVVEQVLPFFTPQYNVTVKPIDDYDLKEDNPITFTGITLQDDYEATLEARRTIIYTLDFEMKISLYRGATVSGPIITRYDVDVMNMDGGELFTISDSANIAVDAFGTLNENTSLTVDTFKIRNVPDTTYNFRLISGPSNGTASITFNDTLTTVNGIIVASGEWTYTPNTDYYGNDTFTIGMLYGDSSEFTFNINVTVNEVV